jgi:hypothetical protein
MGVKYVDLGVPATAAERVGRLEKARAALSEASERVGAEYTPPPEAIKAVTPRKAAPEARSGAAKGFDRVAYQREYMRGWRARRRAKPTS